MLPQVINPQRTEPSNLKPRCTTWIANYLPTWMLSKFTLIQKENLLSSQQQAVEIHTHGIDWEKFIRLTHVWTC
jgi:hypothetical protein